MKRLYYRLDEAVYKAENIRLQHHKTDVLLNRRSSHIGEKECSVYDNGRQADYSMEHVVEDILVISLCRCRRCRCVVVHFICLLGLEEKWERYEQGLHYCTRY